MDWKSRIGLAELDAAGGVVIGDLGRANGRPQRMGRDLEPGLDEPILGQLQPLADPPQHLLRRQPEILQAQLGMVEGEVMHEFGRAQMDQPPTGLQGRRLVHQEQGRLIGIAVDMGMDDDEIRGVVGGDEPFLAVEAPAPVLQPGRGLDPAGIGAGIGLGDGEAAAPLPLAGGQQIFLLLGGGAEFQAHRRTPDAGPEAVGDPAELLLDHDLLQHGEAEPAMLLGMVDAGEAPVAHRLAHGGAPLQGQLAMLAGDLLQRDQHLVAEFAAPLGQLLFARRQLQIHGSTFLPGKPAEGRRAAA